MANRIDIKLSGLRRSGQKALALYLTVGFPNFEASIALARAAVEAGADLLELGVPFSDPLADGPTIQRSSFQALQQGVTLSTCLEALRRLRKELPDTPLVFMGYYNPFFRYGLDTFAKDAADAGLDGLIVADLPEEEVAPLRAVCAPRNVYIIPLLAPTSTEERIAAACKGAQGFVYCVSITGVTGARSELPANLRQLLDRVRRHTRLPVLVGFGVSTRKHVETISEMADGVVVGSAFIDAIESGTMGQEAPVAREFVRRLKGVHRQRGGDRR